MFSHYTTYMLKTQTFVNRARGNISQESKSPEAVCVFFPLFDSFKICFQIIWCFISTQISVNHSTSADRRPYVKLVFFFFLQPVGKLPSQVLEGCELKSCLASKANLRVTFNVCFRPGPCKRLWLKRGRYESRGISAILHNLIWYWGS